MSTAHTPGPWKAIINKQEGARIEQAERHGKSVAWVGCDDTAQLLSGRVVERMSDEAQANARLIAAAPDLLKLLERYVDGESPSTLDPDVSAAVAKVAIP